LDAKDIPGTSPKDLGAIRGVKRRNFFPQDRIMNDYYNKESHGGNVSPKGHFIHKHDYN